jgi:3-hydroxybutyryl-CoA dehydrogenase
MGRGIALLAATLGQDVLVWGRSEASVAALRAHVLKWTAKKIERGELTREASETLVSRIRDTTQLESLAVTGFVIESIAEDLASKRSLFGLLDGLCQATTVLATNTSSLLVRDIAGTMSHPERFIGTHFMNPPSDSLGRGRADGEDEQGDSRKGSLLVPRPGKRASRCA